KHGLADVARPSTSSGRRPVYCPQASLLTPQAVMKRFLLAFGYALLAAAILLAAGASTVRAQTAPTTLEELVSAVVRVKAFINPDGRTVATLGAEREGTGIVIGSDGLVVTIGYLMLEAHAVEIATSDGHTVSANVVGYDHETGFGLL